MPDPPSPFVQDDIVNQASSPTPTIRGNRMPATVPSPSDPFADPARSGTGGVTSGERSQQVKQQDLGKGRPGRGDNDQHRPSPLISNVSPSSQLRTLGSPRAASIRSFSTSTDDEYYDQSQPRTAAPGLGGAGSSTEPTPRGGTGSRRGFPQTAFGSSFGSPTQRLAPGSTSSRPSRAMRFNTTTAFPNQSGTMSRSASRARPPLQTVASSGAVLTTSGINALKDQEDDSVEVEDRGEDLIKRRLKERRRAKKEKERERERRMVEGGRLEGSTPGVATVPTTATEETFGNQQSQGRGSSLGPGMTSRSVSRSRAPSGGRDQSVNRKQASAGYFPYYAGSIAGSETPRDGALSPRDEMRPPSIYSAAGDEDDERMDRAPSVLDDLVQEVVDEINAEHEEEEDVDEDGSGSGDEGVTLRDRQDAINIEHPFGLPIWKPALYKKSRSVTRNADSALHSIPSAAAERHLLPGNILWVLIFGWWLALVCLFAALLVGFAEVLGGGRGGYGKTLRGLAWYVGWPFGKYVEGEGGPEEDVDDQQNGDYGTWNDEENGGSPDLHGQSHRASSDGGASHVTVRERRKSIPSFEGLPDEPRPSRPDSPSITSASTIRPVQPHAAVSFAPNVKGKARDSLKSLSRGSETGESAPLLGKKSGGAFRRPRNQRAKFLGRLVYWPAFFLIIAPSMLFICVLCWGMVITIPMAKLTWALLELLYLRPLEINFRSAPKVPVPTPSPKGSPAENSGGSSSSPTLLGEGSPGFTMKRAHLTAGQIAPTSGPTSTVLLCTYRAVGLQYYKYTIGGVNILFINLLPLVFFTIMDAFLLLPIVENNEHHGRPTPPLLALIASQALIFILSLASVIPLSYFIGMAVASISAQSSIGMGAVINATFGSIIEIILYGIALTQGKGRLVEGSIVGSILAGVLLMPGVSMCSGALKRKEQKFNAKSAGVTSTMLIMAIIGTLTPTMFYQTYGSFELHCEGCPDDALPKTSPVPTPMGVMQGSWKCDNCYYEHPDPASDPFYQDQVKTLMYCCAVILLLSYLIGLWFSLRTHASQIWQNPQQLMKSDEPPVGAMHPAHRSSLYNRITPQAVMQHVLPVHKDGTRATPGTSPSQTTRLGQLAEDRNENPLTNHHSIQEQPLSSGNYDLPVGYTPFLETVSQDIKSTHVTPMRLPATLTTEDFTRAVAVATVSALRHQGSIIGSTGGPAAGTHRPKPIAIDLVKTAHGGLGPRDEEDEDSHGGHEGPSWTRGVSAGVLLGCTLLYAIIAEILVDVVDVVLQGSAIDEKFLGLTLFALVPNTTEFMNAMSFALNGNIALSMEIGSAYALQVCLLQIPAMVAFSAFYRPDKMGDVIDTFTLIFPRWDVIAIILSIFLLTYTYIEARSNYHRGSILVLAYIVLTMGFYFAPPKRQDDTDPDIVIGADAINMVTATFQTALTKLWA